MCGLGGRTAVAEEPRPLRLMAYNVLYDSTGDAASIALIRDVDPDILCLRELRTPFVRAFEKQLGAKYPQRALYPKKVGTWGAGIVSRFPLSDVRQYPSTPHRLPILEATAETPGGKVTVICVHLAPPMMVHRKSDGFHETLAKNAALRKAQAEHLLHRLSKQANAVVVLGDFNEEPGGDAARTLLAAGFADACGAPSSRCGPTWPGAASPWPALWEIDHILGRGVRFSAARVVRGGGSDHYPVVAELELAP
jgi:endonuclease/exonuclease/phosphatase (EEP) superfamily protein YafD